jgi:di/tricarboxylate transporter
MNNTGVVVLLLPLMVTAGQRTGVSPSRLLLPLSYASITGGTLTLVGTSTTLLVAGLVAQAGRPPIGFLEILPIGACVCAISLAYLVWAGPRLLPDRPGLLVAMTPESTRQFVTSVLIGPRSRFVGRRLEEFPALLERARFLELVRGEETRWPPLEKVSLEAGDLLLVKGRPEDLVTLLEQPGVTGPTPEDDGDLVRGVDIALAEVMVAPRSRLAQQTVVEARMRDRYEVVVMAVMRDGEHVRDHLLDLRLREGDVLLVQGRPRALERLAAQPRDLILLGGKRPEPPRKHLAPVAVGVTLLTLALGASGAIPLSVAVVLGAIAVVAFGCLTGEQAYRSIDLRILVVLGAMFGVGLAAQRSGLAHDVAATVVDLGRDLGPIGLLAMLFLVTSLLTEVVSNAGTAAIMTPIALEAASGAGVSERPFVFAVAIAASCSFLTPVGYQTNLLVRGPGGYRLRDYMRLGLPLQLVLWLAATALLPLFYPFRP